MTTGSPAERLDHAVELLLAGGRPPSDATLRPLLETASLVRAALPPVPGGEQFEERLLGRLTHGGGVAGAAGALQAFARRELRHPSRILAAGAVSSAAVGVTVTAVAVWRSRRHAVPGARPGQR
jgi:hypothetical protein